MINSLVRDDIGYTLYTEVLRTSKMPAARLEQLEEQITPSPLCKINHPLVQQHNIELWVKRDDMLHPIISGNKWRKLKYILKHALSLKAHTIISMGGAYSNHLHALAYCGKILGLKTIGMVRGEQPKHENATLADAKAWGMQLRFVSRSEFRSLRTCRHGLSLADLKPGQYWLPEGGSLQQAFLGIEELFAEINIHYDYLCVPCGTGTTLAGLINAASDPGKLIGFAALKGAGFLFDDIESLLSNANCESCNTRAGDATIMMDYHFGGFAKTDAALFSFMDDFKRHTDITLDSVYTGKMFYGLFDLISQGYFAPGNRIIAIHTGGLQGNRGAKLACAESKPQVRR